LQTYLVSAAIQQSSIQKFACTKNLSQIPKKYLPKELQSKVPSSEKKSKFFLLAKINFEKAFEKIVK
jgi:hypothetical protein